MLYRNNVTLRFVSVINENRWHRPDFAERCLYHEEDLYYASGAGEA